MRKWFLTGEERQKDSSPETSLPFDTGSYVLKAQEKEDPYFCPPPGWTPERDYAAFAWQGRDPEEIRKKLLRRISSPKWGQSVGKPLFFVFSNGVPARYCFSDEGDLEVEHISTYMNCRSHPQSFFGEKKTKLTRVQQEGIENALDAFLEKARECEGGINYDSIYCEVFYSDGRHLVFEGLGGGGNLSRQEAEERGAAFKRAAEIFCQRMEACFPGQDDGSLQQEASLFEPVSGRRYVLTETHNIIGRDPSSAVRISDSLVARIHAQIWQEKGRWYLADLGPVNGTAVNGRKLEPKRPVPLSDGDVIVLAVRNRLIFCESGEKKRDCAACTWQGLDPEEGRKKALQRVSSSETEQGGGKLTYCVFSVFGDRMHAMYGFSGKDSLYVELIFNPIHYPRRTEGYLGEKKIKLTRAQQEGIEDALSAFREKAKECEGGINYASVYCEASYSDGRCYVFKGLGSDGNLSRQEAEERGAAFKKAVEMICQRIEACLPEQGDGSLRHEASLFEPVSGRRYVLTGTWNTIGRNDGCAVTLNDGAVSRMHAAIRQDQGRWEITDLHSTNRTFVNGRKLEPESPVPLSDGDEIVLARTRLIFRESEEKKTSDNRQILEPERLGMKQPESAANG
jgi:pSer/pThr/pTyr-binding forkhead associated (FHA) protein